MDFRERLKELGIELPAAGKPVGTYAAAVRSGNTIYLSGTGAPPLPGVRVAGRLGEDMDVEEGYRTARAAAIALLANLAGFLGDGDADIRIVKIVGYVQCVPGFVDHPRVINGATDLLIEVFGEKGRPARSAVGMTSLPFGIPVELEMIVSVNEL